MPTLTTEYNEKVYTGNDSSVIESIYYNRETWELFVVFHNGSARRYESVPAAVFTAFKGASSVGAYYNANIKNRYYGTAVAAWDLTEVEQKVEEPAFTLVPDEFKGSQKFVAVVQSEVTIHADSLIEAVQKAADEGARVLEIREA